MLIILHFSSLLEICLIVVCLDITKIMNLMYLMVGISYNNKDLSKKITYFKI